MEENNGGTIFYVPPIRTFKDTGFVTHAFNDGSTITTRVLPSRDTDGFMIELEVKGDSGNPVCKFTMDRFAALCLTNALTKNLMDQEELIENEYYNKNQFTISRLSERGGANSESEGLGTREED